jgi:uncharacterized membrane protein
VSVFSDINWGCHGIPERCLHIRGYRMRICARCFGANIGHVVSFILFTAGLLPPFYFGPLLLLPLAVDWSLQHFFAVMSTNFRRVITGLLGGFGVGVMIWTTAAFIFNLVIGWIVHR